ncbi:hypothetical protein M0R45_037393 [Rubus argutus]|uniref:Uncharacterized protein n=1 Tax=Rubus argutus TaxID=59490 RepID=A0AAW1W3D5_RUBAR
MLLLMKSAAHGLDILPGQIPLGAPDLGCRRFIGNNTIFDYSPDHLYSLGFTNNDDNLKLYENIYSTASTFQVPFWSPGEDSSAQETVPG